MRSLRSCTVQHAAACLPLSKIFPFPAEQLPIVWLTADGRLGRSLCPWTLQHTGTAKVRPRWLHLLCSGLASCRGHQGPDLLAELQDVVNCTTPFDAGRKQQEVLDRLLIVILSRCSLPHQNWAAGGGPADALH